MNFFDDPHCLKITQNVSFYNIASGASYVYILRQQNFIKMPKIVNFDKLNFTGIKPRFKKVELYKDRTRIQKICTLRGLNLDQKWLNFMGIKPRFKKVELYGDWTQDKKVNFTGIETRSKKVELYGDRTQVQKKVEFYGDRTQVKNNWTW